MALKFTKCNLFCCPTKLFFSNQSKKIFNIDFQNKFSEVCSQLSFTELSSRLIIIEEEKIVFHIDKFVFLLLQACLQNN